MYMRCGVRALAAGAAVPYGLTTLLCTQRQMTYSTFEAMRKGRRRQDVKTPHSSGTDARTSSSSSSSSMTSSQSQSSSASPKSGIRRREGGTRAGTTASPASPLFSTASGRPLQSAVQAKKEAEIVFPKTLKSGRTAEHNTISQQLYMSKPQHAEEFAEQQQRDRAYTEQMKETYARRHNKTSSADSRFFARFQDYQDIQEGDAYAKVFGESSTTHRLRTAAWQRQFEKENEKVELPYERTNVLARIAPNWFVRYFVNMRDKGGADHLYFLWVMGAAAVSLLWLVGYLFYTAPSRAKPINEVR